MQLNTRQKAMAAVLATTLVGLAADRLGLGSGQSDMLGSATASAAPLPADPARAAQSSKVDATPPARSPVGSAGPMLADRLTCLARERNLALARVDDAFRPPVQWFAPDPGAAPDQASAEPTAPRQFAESHRLSAVLAAGSSGAAIINGTTVRIGQVLDGFRLVAISQRSAILEADGRTVQLSLPVEGRP